jgi:hypothetical protein
MYKTILEKLLKNTPETYLNYLNRQTELVNKLLSVIEELKQSKEKTRSVKIDILKNILSSNDKKYNWEGILLLFKINNNNNFIN